MGTCLDQDQNAIDCGDPNCSFGDCNDSSTPSGALSGYADLGTPSPSAAVPGSLLSQVQVAQAGGPAAGPANPVAAGAGSNTAGGLSFASILNFGSTIVSKVVPPSTSTAGLQLKVNPSTGLSQYFNPTTGQWVGGPVSTTTSGLSGLFSGSSSIILVIIALAIGVFYFAGRKRG